MNFQVKLSILGKVVFLFRRKFNQTSKKNKSKTFQHSVAFRLPVGSFFIPAETKKKEEAKNNNSMRFHNEK